ncbi:SDR family oxidoreductase [Streptomyces libani]|uniref:SDR family oxidoreductase n=2 Tax=Streptomyces nigrescens TaxID=1920 RepID=A0A640T916_STRNI|nr:MULTISPECIES: SDR family oxidoreductase [Streptomyces]WAT95070.1 SDR family oxidoreductase [Streptomyces libani subsp. libani]WAU02682.1 SDR family oxidoreductase [Streptomyces nigrescens]WDT59332.1 SDR family oxidoreductase [Streptomyces sp. G7(2002)]GFE20239.1 short-chain dehydrogenase [Streptomyces libani subsp. libani]GGV86297.1 short-chain dehydrogenase [Streptomyces libani subsp. libani]
MGDLNGKTALVTGSSRGIGRSIAQRLAKDGALVAVHYGSNDTAAKETAESITTAGGRAFIVGAELGVLGDAEALFAAFDTELAASGAEPGLDILVNNAALNFPGRIDQVTPEEFDRTIAVNIKAPFFLAQHGLRRMRDGGRIINISSAVTSTAHPSQIAYSISKGGMDTLTLALAKDLGARGITVNTIAPGWVETDVTATRRATPEGRAALAAYSVFNRIGKPQDIADVAAFLASDDSRWITGQRFDVTGGSML